MNDAGWEVFQVSFEPSYAEIARLNYVIPWMLDRRDYGWCVLFY